MQVNDVLYAPPKSYTSKHSAKMYALNYVLEFLNVGFVNIIIATKTFCNLEMFESLFTELSGVPVCAHAAIFRFVKRSPLSQYHRWLKNIPDVVTQLALVLVS